MIGFWESSTWRNRLPQDRTLVALLQLSICLPVDKKGLNAAESINLINPINYCSKQMWAYLLLEMSDLTQGKQVVTYTNQGKKGGLTHIYSFMH